MDYLIVLFIGIMIGWLMTLFWFAVRNRWQSSQSLRSSYDKTVKEIAENRKKAKEARRKSRNTALRAAFEFTLFAIVVVLILAIAFNLLNAG